MQCEPSAVVSGRAVALAGAPPPPSSLLHLTPVTCPTGGSVSEPPSGQQGPLTGHRGWGGARAMPHEAWACPQPEGHRDVDARQAGLPTPSWQGLVFVPSPELYQVREC